MTSQRARRANPYPSSWELPAAAAAAVLLLMVIAVHGARSIANASVGGGWQFTGRSALFVSLPDILGGDAGAGLAFTCTSASAVLLWVCIAATELVMLLLIVLVIRSALRRWGR